MLRNIDLELERRVANALDGARRDLEAGAFDRAERQIEQARALGAADQEIAALRKALDLERRHRAEPQPPAAAMSPPTPAPTPAPVVREVTEAQRREAESLYRRGLVAASDRDIDRAIRFWELAISINPAHPDARQALAREYMVRGMEAFGRGRFQEAQTHWSRVLELDPSNARARGYLDRARTQITRTRELTGSTR